MSTENHPGDIPPFELPDWGEAGAPPEPAIDDPAVDSPREFTLEVETEPILATLAPLGDQAAVIGLITAEGSAKYRDTDLEQATGVAVGAALDRLRDALAASGGTDVYGIRVSLVTRSKRVVALVYGTAVSRR